MSRFAPTRGGQKPGGSFGSKAKKVANAAKSGGQGGQKFPKGMFNELRLREQAVWLYIPEQSYDNKYYDKESKEVIEETLPWYIWKTHFFRGGKNPKGSSFVCSSGPHKSKPCYGCAKRKEYFDKLNAQRDELRQRGMEGVKLSVQPPVSEAQRNTFSVVVTDPIAEVPVLDSKGAQRRNKNQEPITNSIPVPFLEQHLRDKYPTKDGENYYLSVGVNDLAQLGQIDDELRTVCANCAEDLMGIGMKCPQCEVVLAEWEDPVTGEDLSQAMHGKANCNNCGYSGQMDIMLFSECENPEPGSLFSFEVRLSSSKTSENNHVLNLVEFRVPQLTEYHQSLISSPLDVISICKPASLETQKDKMGQVAEGLDPSLGVMHAEPYEGKSNIPF